MFPSPEQVRLAAYHRWRRGGGAHGHDLDDWTSAEQDLLFALNYEAIAQYRMDGGETQSIGDSRRRVCRFCEQAAPHSTFTDPAYALPEFVGLTSLRAYDQCDECRSSFRESFEDDFASFCRASRASVAIGRPLQDPPGPSPYVPIAAFKCLTRMALSIMPRAELESFPDAIEWVLNPAHGLDSRTFGGLGCYLHLEPHPFSAPWTALARRLEDDAPFPYMLYFLGTGDVTFEIPVPLCLRDEDLDGQGLIIPRVASIDEPTRGRGQGHCVFVPLSSASVRRDTVSRTA
jgi:hypothetical protein